ncbi:hypothetical protein BV898_02148 [Hypsibius exemplaris]|uniref:G-protein coupled receptors family 1 profile domain-containing protein n=1 Tax=Hypsibius exemplaris TaxID=2072580 RepID=A0A1W0XAA4_HYPEX|nr:hypothetical protein BV898_02148 [Hypsibius exemplaris]
MPTFALVTLILALLLNGTVLALFAFYCALRTPYNVYVINVLLSNFLCAAIEYPIDVPVKRSPSWYLSYITCVVYSYCLHPQTPNHKEPSHPIDRQLNRCPFDYPFYPPLHRPFNYPFYPPLHRPLEHPSNHPLDHRLDHPFDRLTCCATVRFSYG